MSAITDIILSQVKESAAGKLDKNVLSGLSDSILGSVKQSAQSASGIEQLTQLFTGKTNAADSPVTALAANMLRNKENANLIYIDKMNALTEAGFDANANNAKITLNNSTYTLANEIANSNGTLVQNPEYN